MYCGCPLPGETIGQRLSRLVGSHANNPSQLVPPENEYLLTATHPSDHNAVFVIRESRVGESNQAYRRQKFKNRRLRDQELARKGMLNAELADRSKGHEQAFLVPVPIYSMYDPKAMECAAGTGSFVDITPVSFYALLHVAHW